MTTARHLIGSTYPRTGPAPAYEFVNPWESPGRFLKGNLHAHTTRSDGGEDPNERAARYRAKGYDFLAITDHNRIVPVREVSAPPGLTLIQGVELHPENPYQGEMYHIVALDVKEDIAVHGIGNPQEVLDAVADQGGISIVAHPYWCKQTWADIAPLRGFLGIEVYNATCQQSGRGDSTAQWDEYLNRVGLCRALATDDCHKREEQDTDTYRAWTLVKAKSGAIGDILAALRSGAFYCSCGPEIQDLKIEPAQRLNVPTVSISVTTSPAAEICFVSDIGGSRTESAEKKNPAGVTTASFAANPNARYVRVEVIDAKGRKAWTNPVPIRKAAAVG